MGSTISAELFADEESVTAAPDGTEELDAAPSPVKDPEAVAAGEEKAAVTPS